MLITKQTVVVVVVVVVKYDSVETTTHLSLKHFSSRCEVVVLSLHSSV